jgi:hypothetical protein
MTSQLQDTPEDNTPGMTEHARHANERVVTRYMHAGDPEADISPRLFAAAILEDTDCQAARALAALGIDPSSAARGREDEPYAAPPAVVTPDTMMVRFSSVANEGMGFARERAAAEARPMSTGDLLLGLLFVNKAWRDQLGVNLDAFRDALNNLGPED